MRLIIRPLLLLFLIFTIPAGAYGQEGLKFAELGDFRLENGEVIKDCRIGYRIFGSLDPEKSNAVLFPTWFEGTSQDLVDSGLIGPGKLVDSSRFYVIAVDSLGNGVSSSPSNSKTQSGQSFPEYSIRDMVNAEYLLLTRELHLSQIKAVVGISMGGMQAFQWIVSYPELMAKAVSITGSPRLTSSDLLLMQGEIAAIETGRKCGDAGQALKTVSAFHRLALFTPGYISTHTSPEDFPGYLAGIMKGMERFSPDDWEWQLKAMTRHDIYRTFGGSPEKAASAVRARALVILSRQDHMVNPEPSRLFAGLINAKIVEIDGDCGHAVFHCDKAKLQDPVMDFLTE
jgi:homoserine O-acetyltransferase/O-succinyltransferase